MANFTQNISPSAGDSMVSSQSDKISASLSLTPSPALPLATSASAVAEMTVQSDFFSSYLSQDASSSISELLTFLTMSQSMSQSCTPRETRYGSPHKPLS